MKRKITFLIAAALSVLPAGRVFANWDATGRQIVSEAISNPGAFVSEFQQDLEATTPLAPGKAASLQFGLFPTLAPAGMVNISLKKRINPENNWFSGAPQIELIGGYWNTPWPQLVSDQVKDQLSDASFHGYYAGFLAATSMSPRVRMFYGYKHSSLKAKLTLKNPQQAFGVTIDSFDSTFADDFFIAGLEQTIALEERWGMQLNYGVGTKTIAAKVSWTFRHFELGFNIYPEGVLPVHPVCNYHVDF